MFRWRHSQVRASRSTAPILDLGRTGRSAALGLLPLRPRARTRRILADLGIGASERVFGPIGLDLGADGPEQIAVSVIAELLAVRSGRTAGHLRARPEAVHAGF